MDDFYSRTGERYSIKSPEKEESWVVWVGGAMIGIALATLLVFCL